MKPTPALLPQRALRRAAFTLVEILTVIAIVGILAAIIIPVVGKVRQSAKRTQSVSNLKSIAQGVHLYVAENKGRLPRLRHEDDFWTYQLENYIGKRVRTETKPGEIAYVSPVLLDPLCPKHHALGDYGINDWFVKSDTNEPFSNIQNPSRVILVACVRETDPDQGTWRLYTAGAISANYENETMRLTDRGLGGGYPVAYADGHTAILDKETYRDQATRRKLLRDQ